MARFIATLSRNDLLDQCPLAISTTWLLLISFWIKLGRLLRLVLVPVAGAEPPATQLLGLRAVSPAAVPLPDDSSLLLLLLLAGAELPATQLLGLRAVSPAAVPLPDDSSLLLLLLVAGAELPATELLAAPGPSVRTNRERRVLLLFLFFTKNCLWPLGKQETFAAWSRNFCCSSLLVIPRAIRFSWDAGERVPRLFFLGAMMGGAGSPNLGWAPIFL